MADIVTNERSTFHLKTALPFVFRIVFSKPLYIGISAAVFTTFWIIFNVLDQLLFFSPVLSFYVPSDAAVGFILTNVISALMGIVVSMNVFLVRSSKQRLDKSVLSGSILGIASSSCIGCSSIGFAIISTFGSFGMVATDFLTNYQTAFRIISVIVLLWALCSIQKKIIKPCTANISTNK